MGGGKGLKGKKGYWRWLLAGLRVIDGTLMTRIELISADF